MGARLDLTAADAILKEYYTDDKVQNMMYKDAPLFAMLAKMKNFEGDALPVPIKVTNPQGRSATFASAKANKQSSVYKKFTLTRVKDYSLASIETETILAAKSDKGSFLRASTAEIDGSIESLKRSIAWSLYGSGSGAIGQVLAEPAEAATTVITLVNADDIVHFEVGQTINIWSAESGGTQRNTDGSDVSWLVTNVDRDAGTFTLDDAYTSSGTIAANDYIFVEGDRGAKLSGLAAWLPATVTATSFFGVDRTVDATRLGGIRVSGTNKPLDEAFIDAARRASREGGRPDYVTLSYTKYAQLEKTLGSRIIYDVVEAPEGSIGFTGIKIVGPKGPIMFVPDQDCPSTLAYMLQMNSWKFYSLGEPCFLQDLDSNRMLRESDADAYEVRSSMYAQLGCAAPGWNVRVALS